LLLISATQITADSKRHYLGISEVITEASTDTISRDSIADLSIKYGYMINCYLDIEAIGTFQLLDNTKIDHVYSYGLFLKPNYNLTNMTNIYGLIGYSKNKLVKNDKNFLNKETIQYDFSYGAGWEFEYKKNQYLCFDYLRYIDKSTTQQEGRYAIKIDSIGIGLKYNFSF